MWDHHLGKHQVVATVLRVIVINNNELLDENGNESEEKGIQFCKDHYGQDTKWIQTSYNTRGGVYYQANSNIPAEDQSKALRKNYAGIGYIYDNVNDVFYPPKPFDSWTLNTTIWDWTAPIPHPQDGNMWDWDESAQQWIPSQSLGI